MKSNEVKQISVTADDSIELKGTVMQFYRYVVQCPIHGEQAYHSLKGRPIACPVCEREREEREKKYSAFKGELEKGMAQLANSLKGIRVLDSGECKFETFTLDQSDPNQGKAFEVAKKFAGNFLRRHGERFKHLHGEETANKYRNATNILMTGKCGTGKTHLARAIVYELQMKGVDAFYVRFPQLSTLFFDRERSQPDLTNALSNCSCLVLDEIGAYQHSEYDIKRLFEILDRRNENALPTVFLTNLNAQDFANVIGKRSADRVCTRLVVLPFTWESYRAPLVSGDLNGMLEALD